MSLKISTRLVDDVSILDLHGRLTLGGGCAELREAVRELLRQGNRKILLNMAEVTYACSSGIGEMISAFTAVSNASGSLKLLGLTKKVHDLLQITKFYTVFDIHEDEETALKSFAVTPKYCLCPVCHHPSQPSLLEFQIVPQLCGNCLSQFEAHFSPYSFEQAQIECLCLLTYENEYLRILPGKPFTLQIMGRLDLFSSSALEKAWHSLPTPRRVLFDLRQATEISDGGRSALLTLLANSEEEAKATISVEGLVQEQMKTFPIKPPVYSDRASALAALGDVSDTPAWTIPVITQVVTP